MTGCLKSIPETLLRIFKIEKPGNPEKNQKKAPGYDNLLRQHQNWSRFSSLIKVTLSDSIHLLGQLTVN